MAAMVAILNDVGYFSTTSHADTSFKSFGLVVQEKKFKIDFQNIHHLRFPIRLMLAISYLQVIPDTYYQVSSQLLFGSGR